MPVTFSESPHIRPLGGRFHGILQVLLTEFALTKEEGGLRFHATVTPRLGSVVDGEGKREFAEAMKRKSEAKKQLADALGRFHGDPQTLSYRFNCGNFPLRYGNGGALPVIQLDGEKYFCLFYRDIFPIGWNIANGASDSVEEMLNPERIILREFGEELLICDHRKKLVYAYHPGEEIAPPDFQGEALRAWNSLFPHRNLAEYRRLPTPLKWIAGPDRVCVEYGKTKCDTNGYFLSITPEDNAIEVDRIALINLAGDVSIFDGEYSPGVLFNRVVGLFSVNKMQDRLEQHSFRPDIVFFNGKAGQPAKLEEGIRKCLKSLWRKRPDRENLHDSAPRKLDLCPISRSVIRHYLAWAKREGKLARPLREPDREVPQFDIFISSVHENQQIAQLLHEFLKRKGHQVFLSTETLAQLGADDYSKAICTALQSASCLIVLGATPSDFQSGWVEFEWSSFLCEILSGRKAQARLFTFAANVAVDQLPWALRSYQMIPYSPSSPQDSFETLVRYIDATKL